MWSIVLTYGPLLSYSDEIHIYDFSNEDPLVNLGIELRFVLTFGGFPLPLDWCNELDVIDGRR